MDSENIDIKWAENTLDKRDDYKEIFFNDHTVMLLIDPVSLMIVDANHAATNFYGYSLEEFVKLKISDINIASDEFVLDKIQKSVSKEKNHFKFKHQLSSGEIRDVEVHSGLIKQSGKDVLYSIIHDITHDQQHIILKRLYSILSSLYGAILLVSDTNQIEFTNQAFCDFFKLDESPEELIRLDSNDIIEKIKKEYLNPDEAVLKITEIVAQNKPIKGEEVELQNGRTCIRDYIPINISRKSYGRLWHHYDITERKQTEKKLYESEKLYRSIINNIQDGFFRLDKEGTIIMASPSLASIYGFNSVEDIIGLNAVPLYKNLEDRNRLMENLEKDGQINDYEVEALKTDGKSVWVSINAQYNYDDQNQIEGIDGFVRNISKRKETENYLQEMLRKEKNLTEELQTSNEELQSTTKELQIANEELHSIGEELIVTNEKLFHQGDELLKINNELGVSEERYRNILDNLQDAYMRADIEGNIVMVSPSAAQMFRFNSTEDMIGKSAISFYKNRKDIDYVLGELKKHGKVENNVVEALRNDGTTIFASQSAQYYHENGQIHGIETLVRDVTENKKAEEEILMRRRVLDAINKVFQEYLTSETLNDVVQKCLEEAEDITQSEFGFFGEINENGHLDDRALSPPAWDVCETPNAHKLLKNMEIVSYWGRTIKEEKSQIVNDPESDPDRRGLPEGHPPITSFLGVPLKEGKKTIGMIALANKKTGYNETDKKNVEALAVAFVEVFMRKKAEIQIKENLKNLAESNKELEQFAYITSHDLREPLRMITSFLQLLERRYKDQLDEDAGEFIGFAVDGAKRLDAMTNDLLQYSRIARQDREITLVNFEEVLKEALSNLKIPIEENNAVITHDPLPTIRGDKKLKVQLFQNIISNSIKYRSQETPRIHISAKKENNQYLFKIKDNGIGMSPEHLERIFTIFQRLHTHEEYEGTGIGLAIAQKIVHQQGGEIWAEAVQGKGSTFYFTIQIKHDNLSQS